MYDNVNLLHKVTLAAMASEMAEKITGYEVQVAVALGG